LAKNNCAKRGILYEGEENLQVNLTCQVEIQMHKVIAIIAMVLSFNAQAQAQECTNTDIAKGIATAALIGAGVGSGVGVLIAMTARVGARTGPMLYQAWRSGAMRPEVVKRLVVDTTKLTIMSGALIAGGVAIIHKAEACGKRINEALAAQYVN